MVFTLLALARDVQGCMRIIIISKKYSHCILKASYYSVQRCDHQINITFTQFHWAFTYTTTTLEIRQHVKYGVSYVHISLVQYTTTRNILVHSFWISSTYKSAALLECVQISIRDDGLWRSISTIHSLRVRVFPQPNGPHTSEGIWILRKQPTSLPTCT